MRRRCRPPLAPAAFLVALAACGAQASAAAGEPAVYDYEVVAAYPHDATAFTQGLVFAEGGLYESTGLWGRSSLRRVSIRTGSVDRRIDLPRQFFGEGLALVGDRLVALTYKAGKAFVFTADGFRRVGQFDYEGEGWGLAYDGRQLVMSDGSSTLEFRDADTFDVVRAIEVTYLGAPLGNLSELEIVGDRIFANVYGADQIVSIDPSTGVVDAVIDLTGIIEPEGRRAGPGDPPPVLNGIAYDPEADRLFVTGKLWTKLFEIRLVPRDPAEAPE